MPTLNDKDIMIIAEAMGYSCNGCSYYEDEKHGPQFAPNIDCGLHGCEEFRFDPSTSHADCHALIEWLNERKIFVEVSYFVDGQCWVQIEGPNHRHRDRYEGLDYRLGVVELTLKLLEKEGD